MTVGFLEKMTCPSFGIGVVHQCLKFLNTAFGVLSAVLVITVLEYNGVTNGVIFFNNE